MGSITLQNVQGSLDPAAAYPHQPRSEETLSIDIDGVEVTLTIVQDWRRTVVRIIQPFEIDAWIFDSPLFALGALKQLRRANLENTGVSERDDCIARASKAYRRHISYLKVAPQIEAAQKALSEVFSVELETLRLTAEKAEISISNQKGLLRNALNDSRIERVEYLTGMKALTRTGWHAEFAYSDLIRQIVSECELIKHSMIDGELGCR